MALSLILTTDTQVDSRVTSQANPAPGPSFDASRWEICGRITCLSSEFAQWLAAQSTSRQPEAK
jgi:hypothetical protein